MLSDSNFPIALLLTLIAGLSTGLGGVIVLLTRKFSTKTLSFALGFSAGVMLSARRPSHLPSVSRQE